MGGGLADKLADRGGAGALRRNAELSCAAVGARQRNHTVQTRALHADLRWRNKNARHPDVLAAQRKERARIRRGKGLRWGGRSLAA
jgi:hypothetical protein